MVKTGLDILLEKHTYWLKGKRVGLLCHAPSITPDFHHITEVFAIMKDCSLTAVFGPQHGLFGETQDNMIEWQGSMHPEYKIPVYSLYGEHRKPTKEMLNDIDILIVDLQDVGARLYTYVWTLKLCMEACAEEGIGIIVLDRPNPIAGIGLDGPVLKEEFFTFVGGATVPLCHGMTIGELALWVKSRHIPSCDLRVIPMEGWNRSMMYGQTGLPWVIPSPNMPTVQTAAVYPGTVLFEALNVSEGRGTTLPFELFGAPFIDSQLLLKNLRSKNLPGCSFRRHDFIPTFNKYQGSLCGGLQIHVTNPDVFRPVATAIEIVLSIIETTKPGSLVFNDPPYEYEYRLMPFDILAGDDQTRKMIIAGEDASSEFERWKADTETFRRDFSSLALYKD